MILRSSGHERLAASRLSAWPAALTPSMFGTWALRRPCWGDEPHRVARLPFADPPAVRLPVRRPVVSTRLTGTVRPQPPDQAPGRIDENPGPAAGRGSGRMRSRGTSWVRAPRLGRSARMARPAGRLGRSTGGSTDTSAPLPAGR